MHESLTLILLHILILAQVLSVTYNHPESEVRNKILLFECVFPLLVSERTRQKVVRKESRGK